MLMVNIEVIQITGFIHIRKSYHFLIACGNKSGMRQQRTFHSLLLDTQYPGRNLFSRIIPAVNISHGIIKQPQHLCKIFFLKCTQLYMISAFHTLTPFLYRAVLHRFSLISNLLSNMHPFFMVSIGYIQKLSRF